MRPSPPDVRFKDAMESACGGSSSVYSRFVGKILVICCNHGCELGPEWRRRGLDSCVSG